MWNVLLPYSICVEATGAKLLCCYSWEAREQICGGPGAASSRWHPGGCSSLRRCHWSLEHHTSPIAAVSDCNESSPSLFWPLSLQGSLDPVSLYTGTNFSAGRDASCLWMNVSLAEMGRSHIWSCCSPTEQTTGSTAVTPQRPAPTLHEPCLDEHFLGERGGMGYFQTFFFLSPFSATIHCSCRMSFHIFTSVSALSGK